MELIIASRNRAKIKEIKTILKGLPIKVMSLLDFETYPNIKESGRTFKENASKKAKTVARRFKKTALADDSGLMVDALKGAPGIRSARFAGPNPTAEKLCKKLLRAMKSIPAGRRKAKFVCDIAVASPAGKIEIVEGICSGKIGFCMRGRYGFGYDPVFIPHGYKKTFAEMAPPFKNRISHRGRALKKARILLKKIIRREGLKYGQDKS